MHLPMFATGIILGILDPVPPNAFQILIYIDLIQGLQVIQQRKLKNVIILLAPRLEFAYLFTFVKQFTI